MAITRIPETVQALYSELLDQAIRAEADLSPDLPRQGSFVSKVVKGGRYWYLQRVDGPSKRQHYLGPESESLLAWMKEVEEQRQRLAPDLRRRAQLVEMLAAGGLARESAPVAKVLQVLADAGIFRLGAVVVGTQAFTSYGSVLGVRFEQGSLRTQDIDIAQERAVGVALASEQAPLDAAAALRRADPAFFAVPELDPRKPSASFKVRGRDLRVDFLTPARGRRTDPVPLPMFGVAATPLPLLDYLIEIPVQAVVLGGNGVLVQIPRPGRFALHKLWVAGQRPVSEQGKARKDLRQALQLLEVLLEDRPEEIRAAWEGLVARRQARSAVSKALRANAGLESIARTRELLEGRR